MRELKRVYDGLPIHLTGKVLWVQDQYRKNPLSFIEGGTEVIVEYQNNEVLGYDKIKFSPVYIDTIFVNYFGSQGLEYNKSTPLHQKVLLIKSLVNKIYARKYFNAEQFLSVSFIEVWDSDSSVDSPSESLQKYEKQRNEEFKLELKKSAAQPDELSKLIEETEKVTAENTLVESKTQVNIPVMTTSEIENINTPARNPDEKRKRKRIPVDPKKIGNYAPHKRYVF